MIRRSFDSGGDYALNSFISGGEAITQAVSTRLKLFKGEYFLDQNEGVPYFEEILKKPARIAETNKTIRNIIVETDGVKSLNSFESNFDLSKRTLTIQFEATTTDGETFDLAVGIGV